MWQDPREASEVKKNLSGITRRLIQVLVGLIKKCLTKCSKFLELKIQTWKRLSILYNGLITRLFNGIPSPSRVNFKASRSALSTSSNITWYKAPAATTKRCLYHIFTFFKAKVGLSRSSNITWHQLQSTSATKCFIAGDQIWQSNPDSHRIWYRSRFQCRQRNEGFYATVILIQLQIQQATMLCKVCKVQWGQRCGIPDICQWQQLLLCHIRDDLFSYP